MDESLKALLDEYIAAFVSRNSVRQYFALEKAINESEEIRALQEALRAAQKALALSLNTPERYEEQKREYTALKERFDSLPMVVNYRMLQEEIFRDLTRLQEKLK